MGLMANESLQEKQNRLSHEEEFNARVINCIKAIPFKNIMFLKNFFENQKNYSKGCKLHNHTTQRPQLLSGSLEYKSLRNL